MLSVSLGVIDSTSYPREATFSSNTRFVYDLPEPVAPAIYR